MNTRTLTTVIEFEINHFPYAPQVFPTCSNLCGVFGKATKFTTSTGEWAKKLWVKTMYMGREYRTKSLA